MSLKMASFPRPTGVPGREKEREKPRGVRKRRDGARRREKKKPQRESGLGIENTERKEECM